MNRNLRIIFRCYNERNAKPQNKNCIDRRPVQEFESKVPADVSSEPARYEAPGIESVMTDEDMGREVAYAGAVSPSGLDSA
jgi:hypothetical protein